MQKCEECGEVSWLMVSEARYLCHGCFTHSKGGKMRDRDFWAGPFIGKILINREKAVLFESLTAHLDKLLFPAKQWIPKVAFKSDGVGFDISANRVGEYYIAKWFIKKIELQITAGIPPQAKVSTKSEVIDYFSGRKRLLRPVLESAQQKRIEEKKLAKAKEERFNSNVDKLLIHDSMSSRMRSPLESEWEKIPSTVENWTRSVRGGEKIFICEASDRPTICPKCKKSFKPGLYSGDKPHFKEVDQEGEVQAWHFKHHCGAELVVLAD